MTRVCEVIGINDQATTIQVYEETTGLKPGEPVYKTDAPISATLGPGILSNIFVSQGKVRRMDENFQLSGGSCFGKR